MFHVVLVCFLALCEGQLPYGNVHFVDKSLDGTKYEREFDTLTCSLLFRGSSPVLNGTQFLYDRLVSALKHASEKAGVVFPSKFRLVDVSFLTIAEMPAPIGDIDKLTTLTEFGFFQDHPDLGQFIFWQVSTKIASRLLFQTVGEINNSSQVRGLVKEFLVSTLDKWLGDQLVQRAEALHALLNQKGTTTPLIWCLTLRFLAPGNLWSL
jgi:hypothetical protein